MVVFAAVRAGVIEWWRFHFVSPSVGAEAAALGNGSLFLRGRCNRSRTCASVNTPRSSKARATIRICGHSSFTSAAALDQTAGAIGAIKHGQRMIAAIDDLRGSLIPRSLFLAARPSSSSSSSSPPGASGSTINSNGPMPSDIRFFLQQLFDLGLEIIGHFDRFLVFVFKLFLQLVERLRQSIALGEHLIGFANVSSSGITLPMPCCLSLRFDKIDQLSRSHGVQLDPLTAQEVDRGAAQDRPRSRRSSLMLELLGSGVRPSMSS